jgi:hypothetical protein
MFDERGRGFILKGRRAQTERRGRHPYMTQDDARDLITDVLGAHRNHHMHHPARVIVMKTSQFRDEEADGIIEALDAVGTALRDLVWVQESPSVKVLRDGNYPVSEVRSSNWTGKGCSIQMAAFRIMAPILACMIRDRSSSARINAAIAQSLRSPAKFSRSLRSTGARLR